MKLDYLSIYFNVQSIYISSINDNLVSRVKSPKASADKGNNLFLVTVSALFWLPSSNSTHAALSKRGRVYFIAIKRAVIYVCSTYNEEFIFYCWFFNDFTVVSPNYITVATYYEHVENIIKNTQSQMSQFQIKFTLKDRPLHCPFCTFLYFSFFK